MKRHCREMSALCGRGKVSLIGVPTAGNETTPPPIHTEKGLFRLFLSNTLPYPTPGL